MKFNGRPNKMVVHLVEQLVQAILTETEQMRLLNWQDIQDSQFSKSRGLPFWSFVCPCDT